jgi:hypothetical protein
MASYRTLIAAACGGLQPNEVDAFLTTLLEVRSRMMRITGASGADGRPPRRHSREARRTPNNHLAASWQRSNDLPAVFMRFFFSCVSLFM